jgi:hypothetical protein
VLDRQRLVEQERRGLGGSVERTRGGGDDGCEGVDEQDSGGGGSVGEKGDLDVISYELKVINGE